MDYKFYKCSKCGKVIALLKGSACPTMCCGEEMQELIPDAAGGASEKHVPVITADGNTVEVSVGSVTHPMEEAHFIEWIALETDVGLSIKKLAPGANPKAVFTLSENETVTKAVDYCNLHGLWTSK